MVLEETEVMRLGIGGVTSTNLTLHAFNPIHIYIMKSILGYEAYAQLLIEGTKHNPIMVDDGFPIPIYGYYT